ncbi:MAG: heavy metal-binding domain-containing protein, partial [Propionibacteriaceae bacterium]|nr:heavy metal-binding domain-containing protein [Propionibacteriaceae bacterium]
YGAPNPYGQPQGQPNPYAQSQPQQRPQSAPSATGPEGWQGNQPGRESVAPSAPLTIAEHAVPVHTLEEDPESFIATTLGEVIGVALRPASKDLTALTRARQEAVSRMAEMAKAADADAVVGLRFDSTNDEIVAYGTAVTLADELEMVSDVDLAQPAGAELTGGTSDLSAAAASAGESSDNGHTDFSGPLGSDDNSTGSDEQPARSVYGNETPFSAAPGADDVDATRLARGTEFGGLGGTPDAASQPPAPAVDDNNPWRVVGQEPSGGSEGRDDSQNRGGNAGPAGQGWPFS